METLAAVIIAVFGAGGLVQLVKAIRDWHQGKAQREVDAEERHITRLEKRIEELEHQHEADARRIEQLVIALGKAGIDVPPREA